MRCSFPLSLSSIFALFAVATSGYAIAISSPGSSSEQLVFTTSPNSTLNTLVRGNPFINLFIDYDQARREAATRGTFVYPQMTIWTVPFPGNGYSKSFTAVTKPLPAVPASALLEAGELTHIVSERPGTNIRGYQIICLKFKSLQRC